MLPSYGVVGGLLLLAAAGTGAWGALLRAALGGLALYALYFVLLFIYPAGMGFGDVKLAGILGAVLGWAGWAEVAVGAFLGFAIGGVVGIALMASGRAGRKTQVPFGPSMLAGAWVGLVAGAAVGDWYLRATGL